MLLSMLWQSVAMARVGSTVSATADLSHALLHWQGEAHQHHDDGSYELDDSSESLQHAMTDHLNASLALAVAGPHPFPPLGSAAPDGLHAQGLPNPSLDGLLRPPRRCA